MKLLITMNMPARAGALVHQVYAEYDCDTLEEFHERIHGQRISDR